MLTKNEEDFVKYWAVQRTRKKQYFRKFSIGLPLAVFVVAGLIINFLSGWYKQADTELRSNASVIIVVLIASLAIVVFITLFSIRHSWERKEQQYAELMKKKDGSADMQRLSQN